MNFHQNDDEKELELTFPTIESARQAAVEEVKNLLPNNDKLSQRVRALRTQYEAKQKSVDEKLRTLVETQVHETTLALEHLRESCKTMIKIRKNFQEIDNQCKQCKELLSNYNDIKKIATARKNLDLTIRMLSKFKTIPEEAEKLFKDMDDDRQLKTVYYKLRKLIKLREKAFAQGLEYSSHLREKLKGHFNVLQQVANKLEEIMWENIRDTLALTEDGEAEITVQMLIIIELDDRDGNPIFNGNLSVDDTVDSSTSNLENGDTSTKSGTKSKLKVATMKERCLLHLEQSICDRFGKLFDQVSLSDDEQQTPEEAEQLRNSIPNMLDVAKTLVEDLEIIYNKIVPCFPDHYHIFEFYEKRYQKFLYLRFCDRTSRIDAPLTPPDILQVVKWIEVYKQNMAKLGIDLDETSKFTNYTVQLLEDYNKINQKMLESLADNILSNELETKISNDGEDPYHPKTHSPQDVFSTLNVQVSVALKELEEEDFVMVIKMCTDVLKYFQDKLSEYLKDNAKSASEDAISEEMLCAIVNDCQEFISKTETLKERCLEKIIDETLTEELEEYIDTNVTGWVQVATLCIQQLSEQIRDIIEEKLLPEFFDANWISGAANVMDDTIATLESFFDDYGSWIEESFYFSRLIKSTLIMFVKSYIAQFVKAQPKAKDQEAIETQLKRDKQALETFLLETINRDGVALVSEKLIQKELEAVEAVAQLINAEEGFMNIHLQELKDILPATMALQVLETVLSMRPDIQDKREIYDSFKNALPSNNDEQHLQDSPIASDSGSSPASRKILGKLKKTYAQLHRQGSRHRFSLDRIERSGSFSRTSSSKSDG